MDVQTHLICTPHSEFRTMLTIQRVTSDEGMESGAGWGSSLPVTCISASTYVSITNMFHLPVTSQ